MSNREQYPAGVPCFVDTLTPDVEAAKRFYGAIFGWEFTGPGAMPDDPPGEYFVARAARPGRGRDRDPAGCRRLGDSPGMEHVRRGSQRRRDRGRQAQALGGARAGGAVRRAAGRADGRDRRSVRGDLLPLGGRRAPGRGLVNEPSAWAMSALSTDDPDRAQEFYGELFGWRAESFDAVPGRRKCGSGACPGYVGGEPRQPVPRDVVAVMMRTTRPPAARRHAGASTSGSPMPTRPRPRRRSSADGWSRRRTRWPASGGRSSPIRTERCSRSASFRSPLGRLRWPTGRRRGLRAAPDGRRESDCAPVERGGRRGGQQDRGPGADHQAQQVREREREQAGGGQDDGRPPAVASQPDRDASQPEGREHDAAERVASRWRPRRANPPISPAAASGAVGSTVSRSRHVVTEGHTTDDPTGLENG